jgi:hypothetical protein
VKTNEIWKKAKEYAKAIWVFLIGIFGPPLVKILLGEAPFPQTKQEWINWIVAVLGSGLAAILVRNKITQKQLDKDPYVVGGTVVETPVYTPATDIDSVPPPTPGLGGLSDDWPKP